MIILTSLQEQTIRSRYKSTANALRALFEDEGSEETEKTESESEESDDSNKEESSNREESSNNSSSTIK